MAKQKAEFDPVKQIDDKKAQAVIWSTASLNAAVDAIKRGLPLKANPFLNNNIQLLKPDLVFRRTPEEIEDWLHCKNDKVFFANKCYLKTPTGVQKVSMREYQEDYLHMCNDEPMSVFLSCRQSGKSTSTAIDAIHELLFNTDKNGLIVSKSGQAGIDLLGKIKDIYAYLPWHLKAGVTIWNVHKIAFDNNSTLWTESPSPTAGLGSTVNYLILDEYAWMPLSEYDLAQMWQNLLPIVTADPDAKVRVLSTQNGFNAFYRLYMSALKGESEFKAFKVDWWQVPEWDPKAGQWAKRTEEWKRKMIRKLGSEEDFNYQYSTNFASSDYCIASRECLTRLHGRQRMFRNLAQDEAIASGLTVNEKCLKAVFIHPDLELAYFKDNNRRFFILIDLAEGHGGDYTVFNIFEITGEESMKQVGYFHCNRAELDEAALYVWMIVQQMFTEDNVILSVELNTYGVLFINYAIQLNEPDYKPEWAWRFSSPNVSELDYSLFARYKKGKDDDELPGVAHSQNSTTIPGIRWNSSNKPVACQMLKGMIEKDQVYIEDLITISELEAFEDKSGKGHYKAAYGHDDIIMTCVQIPQLMKTSKWKNFIEEWTALRNNNQSPSDEYGPDIYTQLNGQIGIQDNMTRFYM